MVTVLPRNSFEISAWRPRVLSVEKAKRHNAIFAKRRRFEFGENGPWIDEKFENSGDNSSRTSWIWLRLDDVVVALSISTDALPVSLNILDLEIAFDTYVAHIETLSGFDVELLGVRDSAPHATDQWRCFSLQVVETHWPVALGFNAQSAPHIERLLTCLPPRVTVPSNLPLRIGLRLGRYIATMADLPQIRRGAVILPEAENISNQDGVLLIADRPFGRATLSGIDVTLEEFLPMSENTANQDTPAIDALGDLPVNLDFVLGHTSLKAGDLAGLGAGSVIELDKQDGSAAIDICIEGRRLGRGELVSIGGRLGIEVLSFAEAHAATSTTENG